MKVGDQYHHKYVVEVGVRFLSFSAVTRGRLHTDGFMASECGGFYRPEWETRVASVSVGADGDPMSPPLWKGAPSKLTVVFGQSTKTLG